MGSPLLKRKEKKCPRCRETKPRSEWGIHKGRPDNMPGWCQECVRAYNREHDKSEKGRERANRVNRGGRNQRQRWYADHMESWVAHNISKALMFPELRCAVCGVPNHVLQEYVRKNRPCPAFIGGRRRMEGGRIDHDLPHIEENIRGECPGCNSLRGHDLRNEDEVREIMVDRWGLEYPSYPEWLILPHRLEKHGKGALGIRIRFE